MGLYELSALSKAFIKKMGKEFCLNAAGTKLIFVAGLQDKGCTLDDDQLNIVYYGVEQILPITEYDLPTAIARWITRDETEEDCASLTLRDSAEWDVTKGELPTYLKHELIAFIFGQTYFDLTDLQKNKSKKEERKRKKGEPVIHRNTNYLASAIEELHDVNLPKQKYTKLIRGFARESHSDEICKLSICKSLFYAISFFMPLSEQPSDEKTGALKVKSLILDRTFHPEKMSATQGFNEY